MDPHLSHGPQSLFFPHKLLSRQQVTKTVHEAKLKEKEGKEEGEVKVEICNMPSLHVNTCKGVIDTTFPLGDVFLNTLWYRHNEWRSKQSYDTAYQSLLYWDSEHKRNTCIHTWPQQYAMERSIKKLLCYFTV